MGTPAAGASSPWHTDVHKPAPHVREPAGGEYESGLFKVVIGVQPIRRYYC